VKNKKRDNNQYGAYVGSEGGSSNQKIMGKELRSSTNKTAWFEVISHDNHHYAVGTSFLRQPDFTGISFNKIKNE
jgi:hypothetical protein